MSNIKELKIELFELNLKLSTEDFENNIKEYKKKVSGHQVGILFFILQLGGMMFLLVKGIYPDGWLNSIIIILVIGLFSMIRLMVLVSKAKQNIVNLNDSRDAIINRINQIQRELILNEQ